MAATVGGERQARIWFAHMLRGVACLLVVFSHMELFLTQQSVVAPIGHFPPSPSRHVFWDALFTNRQISPAAVGVAIFFVISGFVIPFSLKEGDFKAFLVRRFFRLYPTVIAALAITVVALRMQAFFDGSPAKLSPSSVLTNVTLLAAYFGHPWIEPVLWTLAVEELFYLLAAALAHFGVLQSRRVVLLSAALCSSAASLMPYTAEQRALYWLAFNLTFVTFILVGVALHHMYATSWTRRDAYVIVSTVCAMYLLALYAGPNRPQARMYGQSSLFALLIFVACWWKQDRLPRLKAANALSLISYPLYLIHSVNGYIALHAVYVRTHNYWLAFAIALPLAIGGAVILHVVIEKPSMDFGRRIASAPDRGPTVQLRDR